MGNIFGKFGRWIGEQGDALAGGVGALANAGRSTVGNMLGQEAPPASPDFRQLAEETARSGQGAVDAQTRANRAGQYNPANFTEWAQDANGNWTQYTGVSPEVQQAYNNLRPFSFGQFGRLGNGDDARNQAIGAAWNQSTSRLDPMWDRREEASRTRLLNQGLDPSSEAGKNEMFDLGQQRNDAYTSALNAAIGQGTAAGQSVFQQNLAARQQAINEALKQRGMGFEDLRQLFSFLPSQQYNQAGQGPGVNYSGAGAQQYGADWQRWGAGQQQAAEAIQALMGLADTGMSFAVPGLKIAMAKAGAQATPTDVDQQAKAGGAAGADW